MPNWCKGTLRIHGKQDDIERFFAEGLDVVTFLGEHVSTGLAPNEKYGFFEWDDNVENSVYIIGTRRGFVEHLYYERDERRESQTVAIDVRFAWSCEPKELEAISRRFGIDVRFTGSESGMMFTQDICATNGTLTHVETRQWQSWDEWAWESPTPNIGG